MHQVNEMQSRDEENSSSFLRFAWHLFRVPITGSEVITHYSLTTRGVGGGHVATDIHDANVILYANNRDLILMPEVIRHTCVTLNRNKILKT